MDQYSLSQRFQGALLGATIGQSVGQQLVEPIDFLPCLNWLCHQHQPPSLGPDPIANAIALLPLWLYTHESWRERQNRLEQLPNSQFSVAERSRSSILNSQFLWLYGETIAQLLRPTCDPTNLLPSLQTRWQQHANHGAPAFTQPWHNCLTQLHQWQQHRTPLHQVQTELANRPVSERAIAIALYCFIRSPNEWPIAQSLAAPFDQPAIGGLLGGLWGAYNGWTRFPIAAITPSTDPSNTIPFTTTTQQLIQTWSGNMQPQRPTPIVCGPR
jgi:hypothetical protein